MGGLLAMPLQQEWLGVACAVTPPKQSNTYILYVTKSWGSIVVFILCRVRGTVQSMKSWCSKKRGRPVTFRDMNFSRSERYKSMDTKIGAGPNGKVLLSGVLFFEV